MDLQKSAYVYILTNHRKTSIYIGVTTQLKKRITDHKNRRGSIFAKRYNIDELIYLEGFDSIISAIRREKELKKWKRSWKEELISRQNPN